MPDNHGRIGFLTVLSVLAVLSAPILLALALDQRDIALAFAAWFGLLVVCFGAWAATIEIQDRRYRRR